MRNVGRYEGMNVGAVARFESGLREMRVFFLATLVLCFVTGLRAADNEGRLDKTIPLMNTLVKGRVSQTVTVPFEKVDEYTFTALLDGHGGYSMQLFQNGENILEAYNDTVDSFSFNPKGVRNVADNGAGSERNLLFKHERSVVLGMYCLI